MATQCWMAGRIEAAVRYSDEGQLVLDSGRGVVPYGIEGWLGGAYTTIGQPERWVEWCRARLARGRDTHTLTRQPWSITDDRRLRRGLAIAHDSDNRYIETNLAGILCRVEAEYGDPLTALDYFTVAIRNYLDSGNTTVSVSRWLSVLAAFLDRLQRYEPAATIAGYAFSPMSAAWSPEVATAIAHLREVLGDRTYESLARKGETMTTAALVTYTLDQIDQARADLNEVSK